VFLVTPKVVPLASSVVSGSWVGEGDGNSRAVATAGEDDVIPRAYRDGDELRRVHWRSTARYGELMVRREEQRWRNRTTLLLDTRRSAHAGSGASSSFEFAVSAAASIGVHMAHADLDGRLITDTGPIASSGMFEDVLLDALSVIRPSSGRDLSRGISALRRGQSGLIIVVAGQLTAAEARLLAAARHDGKGAIALLLAVSSWADAARQEPSNGTQQKTRQDETDAAASVLRGAGWRVVSIDASTPLSAAWQRLPKPGGLDQVTDSRWMPEAAV
jgi:uncharacterized protein (DUF58 family)